ncbi:hypothetical protein BKN38_03580 [Helicobacter sp. CLO-3]|nr:hypothetical protein BA723_07730 [Helicobacter sp. CLO-3]OHU84121.1 hypothetical protein BKN38_03580 [Helicobacter sp. CLO-3]
MILAGVVVYYLYQTLQEYLKNPHASNPQPNTYPEYTIDDMGENPYYAQSPLEKLKNSYAGASVAMLAKLLQAGIVSDSAKIVEKVGEKAGAESSVAESVSAVDSVAKVDSSAKSNQSQNAPESTAAAKTIANKTTISLLQQAIIYDFIKTIATSPKQEAELFSLLCQYAPKDVISSTIIAQENTQNKAKSSDMDSRDVDSGDTSASAYTNDTSADDADSSESIAKLAEIFLDNTYGEYKKRLYFVGVLLELAWSDGELNTKEQDIILDIAAFLDIENDDFNALYDSFERLDVGARDDEAVAAFKQALQSAESSKIKTPQDAFISQVAKLSAKARSKDTPQSELLANLWNLQKAYGEIA